MTNPIAIITHTLLQNTLYHHPRTNATLYLHPRTQTTRITQQPGSQTTAAIHYHPTHATLSLYTQHPFVGGRPQHINYHYADPTYPENLIDYIHTHLLNNP